MRSLSGRSLNYGQRGHMREMGGALGRAVVSVPQTLTAEIISPSLMTESEWLLQSILAKS